MLTSYSTLNHPLNEHVLSDIFSFVYDTSYSTIQSLLLTDRYFYSITRPLVYRRITLNIASFDCVEEILGWLNDPELKKTIPGSIHHISVLVCYQSYVLAFANEHCTKMVGKAEGAGGIPRYSREQEWDIIADLISHTTQLKSLTFAVGTSIPLVLLNAIHSRPTVVDLNISSWIRARPDLPHDDPAELALLGSPCLRSLQAHFYNPECNPSDLRSHAFWRLVRSAPNLNSVALRISYQGEVGHQDSAEEKQQWATLGLTFDDTQRATGSTLRNLKIEGAKSEKAELAGWDDLNLSQLTTLDWTGRLSSQILASLRSLTHLTLRGAHPTVNSTLIACPPLLSLSLIGWYKYLSLEAVLAHHGHSLRSLSLHELETSSLDKPRAVLELSDLHRIRDLCPYIHDLCLDLNIPPKYPHQSVEFLVEYHQPVYEFLSTFRLLRRLQLNFNLGIACSHAPAYITLTSTSSERTRKRHAKVPTIDKSSATQVWYALQEGAAGRVTPFIPVLKLKELRVAQGEAQRPTRFGYLKPRVNWESMNHRWFKVTPSDKGEHNGITTTCYFDSPDFDQDMWRECRW